MATEDIRTAKPTADSKLKDLFLSQLQELYWAEKKLAKVLNKMQEAAYTPELKDTFARHEEQTKGQISRLEKVFNSLEEEPTKSKSPAMAGIIAEVEEIIDDIEEKSCARDVALILVAQKAKHFEIASYGGLAEVAGTMDKGDIREILRQTLQEEKQTDTLLTLIAESGINQKASQEPEQVQMIDDR
jgi:ferritin-like metal-binding protein YciE